MQPVPPIGSADDLEAAANMEEGAPLLSDRDRDHGPAADPSQSPSMMNKAANIGKSVMSYPSSKMLKTSAKNKLLLYDHDSLLTASSLALIARSVFGQKPVLYTLAYCCSLAGVSALAVFFIPKASKLDTQKFQDFALFLKFFISFMLGIYVQQAFKRWWMTVTTFEKILIGIRQLVFMLHTLRFTASARTLIENYCIASSYILNVEVRNAQMIDTENHSEIEHVYDKLVHKHLVTDDDVAQLRNSWGVLSKTRACWSWIGELVSHPHVEEGHTVAPPLLVRTIMMCQSCVSEIDILKMNITMQTPFMYAQLLAILVHVNNAMLAIVCGVNIGSAFNEIHRRNDQLSGERKTIRPEMSIVGELYQAFQTVGIQLAIVLLTPMLYIAFLHIAHILCYPFGEESYHLPTETLIKRLHIELDQMTSNRGYFRSKLGDIPELGKKKGRVHSKIIDPNDLTAVSQSKKQDEVDDDDCD